MRKYRRVTYVDRCQIQAFLQAEFKVINIAKKLSFHKSTIYRELLRSKNVGCYYSDKAQMMSWERIKTQRRDFIIVGLIQDKVKKLLELGLSPEQISGRLKDEKVAEISHQTIYEYIYRHKELLGKYLKRFKRRGAGRYLQRKNKISENKISIHDRANIANQRGRIGDWERDSMFVGGKLVLVCADRKTRFIKIAKSNYHTKEVSDLTMQLLNETGKKIYTLTNDNGPEFRDGVNMRIKVHYCDPQKPQQRGTVENTIGLLRKYLKRSDNLNEFSDEKIKNIEMALNLRPRRCLDYLTPYEVFYGKRVALAS